MTASKYGTIRYKKSTYSVPDSMIMTDCRVIAGCALPLYSDQKKLRSAD
jgi:hypothetical protein